MAFLHGALLPKMQPIIPLSDREQLEIFLITQADRGAAASKTINFEYETRVALRYALF